MKRASTKTSARDRYYSQLREVWIGYGDPCQARISGVCQGAAVDVHHKAGRGLYVMLRVETWAAVCRPCHRWIEENRRDPQGRSPYDLGLKLRTGEPMPKKSSYGRCKGCAHPIFWVVTVDDQSMPLDADPDTEQPLAMDPATVECQGRIQEHNSQQTLGGKTETIVVEVLANDKAADTALPIWRSHFATCRRRAR